MQRQFRLSRARDTTTGADFSYVVHPPTSIGVYANERGEYLLLQQYRPIFGRWFVELPGGLLQPHETPRQALIREFKEETGYGIIHARKLLTIIPTIGMSSEKIHIFKATAISAPGRPRRQPDEAMRIVWIKRRKLLEMIDTGKILDAKTIIGILADTRPYRAKTS